MGSEDPRRIVEDWHNSSSANDGSCVDTRMWSNGDVDVRHSKNHDTVITYTQAEWDAFVGGVLDGRHRAVSRF